MDPNFNFQQDTNFNQEVDLDALFSHQQPIQQQHFNPALQVYHSLPQQKQQYYLELLRQNEVTFNNKTGLISNEELYQKTQILMDPNVQLTMADSLKRPTSGSIDQQSIAKRQKMDPRLQISSPRMGGIQNIALPSNLQPIPLAPASNLQSPIPLAPANVSAQRLGKQPIALATPARKVATPKSAPKMPLLPSSAPSTPQVKQEVELDLEGMMDVTNYANVDLREEEFSMQEGTGPTERVKETLFLNVAQFEKRIVEFGTLEFMIVRNNGLMSFDPDYISFVSQAAEAYITSIITKMCDASEHRANTDYEVLLQANGTGTGDYDLDIYEEDNVKLQLLEIENRERQLQEQLFNSIGTRPTEEEEQEQTSTAPATQVSSQTVSQKTSGQSTDSSKKKKPVKKDVPEAVKNRLTNNAAMMAAGGTMKSWMLPGASITAPTPLKMKETKVGGVAKPQASVRTGSRLRVQKRITIKDALSTMENYKHLKTTELFYKWWASVK